MRGRASGHRNRLEAIELEAPFLAFFPGQELLDGHRLADGDIHAAHPNDPPSGFRGVSCGCATPWTSAKACPQPERLTRCVQGKFTRAAAHGRVDIPIGDLFDRARRLDLAGRETDALQAYLDVLASDMAHAGALNHLAALLGAAGYQGAARLAWQQAVERCPDDPRAHVCLGDLSRGDGDLGAALDRYRAALLRDPALPEAHQGMAHVLAERGEDAAWHRARGFAPRALTTAAFRGAAAPVSVLRLVSCIGGNIPTRHLLPDKTFQTHTLVVEYADRVPALPPHAVVFNAIGDADLCRAGLLAAASLPDRTAAPSSTRPAPCWRPGGPTTPPG